MSGRIKMPNLIAIKKKKIIVSSSSFVASFIKPSTYVTTCHKPIVRPKEAIRRIESEATLLIGGFGLCGIPEKMLQSLAQHPEITKLRLVSNDAGTEDSGIGPLLKNGQIQSLMASYIGENRLCTQLYLQGKLIVELMPQGSIAEGLRASGAGIPFFYTKSGVGTWYADGLVPTRYSDNGVPVEFNIKRENIRASDGKTYLREAAIPGDYALIKAWKADPLGNLLFHETARNFNPVMAKAAKKGTFVEVEELVPIGELSPDSIHLPGIYVDVLVHDPDDSIYMKHVFKREKNKPERNIVNSLAKERIAKRAAKEFHNGIYVNLGIGIPELALDYIPKEMTVIIDSENGVLGVGQRILDSHCQAKVDPDLVNAGKEAVGIIKGSSFFSSDESFAMIRGARFHMSMLGAFEVSCQGDLANWIIPGHMVMGMGGAMDLAMSGSRIVVTMTHCNKNGKSKLVKKCSLPLTAARCVDRVITDLAVFDVDHSYRCSTNELTNTPPSLILREIIAKGETVESIQAKTDCPIRIP